MIRTTRLRILFANSWASSAGTISSAEPCTVNTLHVSGISRHAVCISVDNLSSRSFLSTRNSKFPALWNTSNTPSCSSFFNSAFPPSNLPPMPANKQKPHENRNAYSPHIFNVIANLKGTQDEDGLKVLNQECSNVRCEFLKRGR